MPLPGPTVMVTVELPPERATLAAAREQLGLAEDEVDEDFGLVPLDPDRGTYAVLVRAEAGSRAAARPGAKGPYENPTIGPLGPPQATDG